jgi:hypothetical protein
LGLALVLAFAVAAALTSTAEAGLLLMMAAGVEAAEVESRPSFVLQSVQRQKRVRHPEEP